MSTTLWKLPVPSTAFLGGGPTFENRPRREVAIRFSYESEEDDQLHDVALVFEGVEAFKCTYYRACDSSMLEAYDRLVDRGSTSWLNDLSTDLERNGGTSEGLAHLMITFDDGPCYEIICRSYRIENG